jgi:hypothetical protein
MMESLGVGGRHGLFIMSGTTKAYHGSQLSGCGSLVLVGTVRAEFSLACKIGSR